MDSETASFVLASLTDEFRERKRRERSLRPTRLDAEVSSGASDHAANAAVHNLCGREILQGRVIRGTDEVRKSKGGEREEGGRRNEEYMTAKP